MKIYPIKLNKINCSYSCPYYQDGPVISLCNKFGKILEFDNYKPLLLDKCKKLFEEK